MMKTHYDPFLDEDDCEQECEKGFCGTLISDGNVTSSKSGVTCKKCISLFELADKQVEEADRIRSEQEDGFIDFLFEERYKCECGFKGCMDQLKYEVEEVTFEPLWKCPECNTTLERN